MQPSYRVLKDILGTSDTAGVFLSLPVAYDVLYVFPKIRLRFLGHLFCLDMKCYKLASVKRLEVGDK